MRLTSRHPRGPYSAPAAPGQEGEDTHRDASPAAGGTDRAALAREAEERLLSEIETAARAGRPLPGLRTLVTRLGLAEWSIRNAGDRLEKAGRIRRQVSPAGTRYELPALGLITAIPVPHRPPPPPPKPSHRPPPRDPGKPPSLLAEWPLKRDAGLTGPQRQALSAARAEIAETGSASVARVARRLGITENAAGDRLRRITGRGHLLQGSDGRYVPAPEKPAADAVRVEIRDGVRVTVCPPRHAEGALVFGSALGRPAGRRR